MVFNADTKSRKVFLFSRNSSEKARTFSTNVVQSNPLRLTTKVSFSPISSVFSTYGVPKNVLPMGTMRFSFKARFRNSEILDVNNRLSSGEQVICAIETEHIINNKRETKFNRMISKVSISAETLHLAQCSGISFHFVTKLLFCIHIIKALE